MDRPLRAAGTSVSNVATTQQRLIRLLSDELVDHAQWPPMAVHGLVL
jgi:hypothetical protein